MKTEKEKAEEILRERERAKKGIAVTNDEGEDPLKSPEDTEEREQKVDDAALSVDFGLKR